ncbi:MAG: hypothetical protein PHH00_01270 [Candidatus Nanoarchaeia archaeon]|nr:hypothetical protein [Candidatus Nanoarchaeia archaeon]
MINPDILGGLKSALARGYTLEEAVLSFLNGGYKKEEIEEAAQSLQPQIVQSAISSEWSPQPIWASKQNPIQPPLISQKSKQAAFAKQKPVQPRQVVTKGVAAYTSYDNSKIKTVTIILVILLVVLLGILGLMYLFKGQIIDFFNGLF